MQRDAVWWLYHVVPQQYRVTATHYYSTLKQVLFLEDPNVYAAKGSILLHTTYFLLLCFKFKNVHWFIMQSYSYSLENKV